MPIINGRINNSPTEKSGNSFINGLIKINSTKKNNISTNPRKKAVISPVKCVVIINLSVEFLPTWVKSLLFSFF
jgi:hypothetical protein